MTEAVRRSGHAIRLIDLQLETHKDYQRLIESWQTDLAAISCNYFATVPEVVELAKTTKARLPHVLPCTLRCYSPPSLGARPFGARLRLALPALAGVLKHALSSKRVS